MFQRKKNQYKGSALVVTIMILGVIMVTALAISFASLQDRKASISSSRSNIAYQNAESGVEKVLQMIKDSDQNGQKIGEVNLESYDLTCETKDGFDQYNLVVAGSDSNKIYSIELLGADGNKINCNDNEKYFSDVRSVKSVGYDDGSNPNNSRAIEAAVASVVSQKVCVIASGGDNANYHFVDFLNVPYNWTIDDCKFHAKSFLPCNSGSSKDSEKICSDDESKEYRYFAPGCFQQSSDDGRGVFMPEGKFTLVTDDNPNPDNIEYGNCGWE